MFSCRKELEKPSWGTHDIVPLIKTSLNINNLLPDSILQTNSDNSLKIIYENDLFNFAVDTLFKMPDTSLIESYVLPFAVTLQPGQNIVNNSLSETSFDLQGAQLKTIVIKSGYISYNVKSYINEVTDFVYSLPSATLNGIPFTINISVPAAVGDVPGVYEETFDLSSYVLSLTGINGGKINTLYTSLSASVSSLGKEVLINTTDSLIINNTFHDFVPYYANGYFGSNTFDTDSSETEFSMFKNITEGTIGLEDVTFNLSIENPIGIDAQIHITNLNSINTRRGTNIGLQNSIIGSPININRAAESNGMVYPTSKNFPLNTSNSNIKKMLENLPDKFGYSLKMVTNPLGNIAGASDFIYSDSLLKVKMNIEIPLSIVANNLTLTDTIDLNLSGEDDKRNLKFGEITLVADNGFPFNATIQIYILNDDSNIVDSLFITTNTIREAFLDNKLRVSQKTTTILSVPLSKSKMDLLYDTKKAIIKLKFNTSRQPRYMKIYADYQIDLKLIGDLKYVIQLK